MMTRLSLGGVLRFSLTIACVVVLAATSARAQPREAVCSEVRSNCPAENHAPEIGLGAIGSALTLLGGSYLVITSRLRRRNSED